MTTGEIKLVTETPPREVREVAAEVETPNSLQQMREKYYRPFRIAVNTGGLIRQQRAKQDKTATMGEIAHLVRLAKKKGASFPEIQDAAIKAYGSREAKKELNH